LPLLAAGFAAGAFATGGGGGGGGGLNFNFSGERYAIMSEVFE